MPIDVRFIEMMPIGYGRKFKAVNNEELLFKIKEEYPGIKKDIKKHGNDLLFIIIFQDFKAALALLVQFMASSVKNVIEFELQQKDL